MSTTALADTRSNREKKIVLKRLTLNNIPHANK